MTKEQLEKNYKEFSNFRIIQLADDPEGLSDLAIDVLSDEINRRELQIEIKFKPDIAAPVEKEFQLYGVEEERTFSSINTENNKVDDIKFPNAIKTFNIDSFSLLILGAVFILLSIFIIYVSLSFLGLDNIFGKLTFASGIAFGFLSLCTFKSSGIKQIVVFQNEIQFQERLFFPGGRLNIFDVFRLFFSKKRTTLQKNEIKQINIPTGFIRFSYLNFELKNGKRYEINIIGGKEEIESIYQFISEYLTS